MTNKICLIKNCELIPREEEIDTWIENYINKGVEQLQQKYPNHHKDCLKRIFAEQLQMHHLDMIGDLIIRNKIEKHEKQIQTAEI